MPVSLVGCCRKERFLQEFSLEIYVVMQLTYDVMGASCCFSTYDVSAYRNYIWVMDFTKLPPEHLCIPVPS